MSIDSLQSTYIKIRVFDLKYNWIAFWKLDSNLVKASLQLLRYVLTSLHLSACQIKKMAAGEGHNYN